MRFFRLLLIVVVIGILVASQGARFLVVDNPQKSDAIVVLAGETSARPASVPYCRALYRGRNRGRCALSPAARSAPRAAGDLGIP